MAVTPNADYGALVASARRMAENGISHRLADGWYPSMRGIEGEVVHDRHVLIWVRSYEALLAELCDAIEALSTNDGSRA